MNNFVELRNLPGMNRSRVIRFGSKLITYGVGVKAAHSAIATVLIILLGVGSVAAQTPTGSFFNGNSSQLGNSLRSVTFFLAAAMIIAGIIFVAVGIVTSGLRESLSTWKFITGAACFAFGGICAAIYAFSQGDTVPLDNQF
jgi:hypothetical protein